MGLRVWAQTQVPVTHYSFEPKPKVETKQSVKVWQIRFVSKEQCVTGTIEFMTAGAKHVRVLP